MSKIPSGDEQGDSTEDRWEATPPRKLPTAAEQAKIIGHLREVVRLSSQTYSVMNARRFGDEPVRRYIFENLYLPHGRYSVLVDWYNAILDYRKGIRETSESMPENLGMPRGCPSERLMHSVRDAAGLFGQFISRKIDRATLASDLRPILENIEVANAGTANSSARQKKAGRRSKVDTPEEKRMWEAKKAGTSAIDISRERNVPLKVVEGVLSRFRQRESRSAQKNEKPSGNK